MEERIKVKWIFREIVNGYVKSINAFTALLDPMAEGLFRVVEYRSIKTRCFSENVTEAVIYRHGNRSKFPRARHKRGQ